MDTEKDCQCDHHEGEDVVELYTHGFASVIKVPQSAIHQLPPPRMNITRLVACKNFSAAVARTRGAHIKNKEWCQAACPMGSWCRFVHVSQPISDFPQQPVHAHYIWRSVEEVSYHRLWTGAESEAPSVRLVATEAARQRLQKYLSEPVEEEVNKTRVDPEDVDFSARTSNVGPIMIDVLAGLLDSIRVPASRLLMTAGAVEHLYNHGPELTLCFNYCCGNECRLGDKCPHAHVINIDPSITTRFVRRSARQVKVAAVSVELMSSAVDSALCADQWDSASTVYVEATNSHSFESDITTAYSSDVEERQQEVESEEVTKFPFGSTPPSVSTYPDPIFGGGSSRRIVNNPYHIGRNRTFYTARN